MSTDRPARESRREGEPEEGDRLVRLNKFLAAQGVASRRRCDELIAEGAVMVDDEIVTDLGRKIDPSVQRVEVDGVIFKAQGVRPRYYLLNKPAGVVCTNEEREARPRAIDLITDRKKGRIYTVGRLDEDTVGIILLTSDGDFANRVSHPRYGLPKTYLVKLAGRIPDEALRKVREGVFLSEGPTAGARVIVQSRTANTSKLLVTIHEGKNREIRRTFAQVGFKVVDLKRVRIGSLTDRGLKPGSWRPLTRAEVADILEQCDPERRVEREVRGAGERVTKRSTKRIGRARAGGTGASRARGRSGPPRRGDDERRRGR
jgi:23S rRNA pseudouridine2605 synthase